MPHVFNFRRTYICLVAVFWILHVCSGYDFDQEYTGVFFNPYVKHPYAKGARAPSSSNYTAHEVEVMLDVITEKFSRVVTIGSGAENVSYRENLTYHNESYIEVYISEVAARLNLRRKSKSITILQGISYYNYNPRMETEVKLAIECAEKANQIFSGTVAGFIFTRSNSKTDFTQTKETLNYLKKLKNSSVAHLKFGTVMGGLLLYDFCQNRLSTKEMQIVQDILRELDFVTCSISYLDMIKYKGVEVAFEVVSEELLNTRDCLRQSYTADKLEVIGQIYWNSEGYNKWDTLQNMKVFWEVADQWARKHKFPIHFIQAFDIPFDTAAPNRGWWRLTENSKSEERAGYVEKIKEMQTTPDTTFLTYTEKNLKINVVPATTTENNLPDGITISIATIVMSAFGAVGFIIIVITSIAVLRIRVNKLQQKLSSGDIRDFVEGVPNGTGTAVQHEAQHMTTSALSFPYKNSYEIRHDQLTIEYDKILGMGEFGCVFKAKISSSDEYCKDVALKIAKDGSSRTVLKGLLSEIKILIYIEKHPNIVVLMGAYTAELHRGIVYIATELCGLGSLQNYLRNHDKIPHLSDDHTIALTGSETTNPVYINDFCERISFHQMVQWSVEIAAGMEYLGTKNVVHADLATRNVLLTTERTAKISDFGLSRRMYNYTNYVKTQQEPLPWRWMAIESLKRNEFSAKSDVWSFGVTLWEIFSMGDQPYPGLTWTVGFVNMLVNGLRLECPTHATPELYQLLVDCWHPEPEQRPSFTDILTVINTIA